jgi:exodeoxyribonuclease-3
VNSVRLRLPQLADWLQQDSPAVVLLQELKCTNADFPFGELQALGYDAVVVGQKAWNGVAVLTWRSAGGLDASPILITDHLDGLEGDEAARYLEVEWVIGNRPWRFASVYVPNGQSLDSDKYAYKQRFLAALQDRLSLLLASEQPVVVGGDFNLAPGASDVFDPARFGQDVLYALPMRQQWRRWLNQGWLDGLRLLHPAPIPLFSWWDYRGNAWPANQGCRIDHLLLSPTAANDVQAAGVASQLRGQTQPSDHAPVWVDLRIELAA